MTQSGPAAVYNAKEECFTVIHSTLRSAFDVVVPFAVDVPSFGCIWGFNLAFNLPSGANADDAAKASARAAVLDKAVDATNADIEERILGGSAKLKFFDGQAWRGLPGLPKEIRKSCEAEDRVMTIDNPVFMFAA